MKWLVPIKYIQLISYPHSKSENSPCDTIAYKIGKDYCVCNMHIKSYHLGTMDLTMKFPHSTGTYILAIPSIKTYFV